MRRAALPVSLAVSVTCLVSAQQPPSVKTITTGIVVDVTVVDNKGNPVLDLAPEDFELSEDGARQTIISASLVHNGFIQAINGAGAISGKSVVQTAEPSSAAGAP